MQPKRVLVTGGTGVIGAWVVRGFATRGITPIVFVRGHTDSIGRALNGDIDDRLVWAYGDVQDATSVERAVREHAAEAIVHMASAKPWQIEEPFIAEPRPREAIEQIVVGTAGVLEAARRTGLRRVVYASSKGVYGDIVGPYAAPTYQPLPEDYPANPRLLYGVGKLAAEHLGVYYARQYGLEFLAIRFSSSFGPLKRGPRETSPDGILQTALETGAARIRTFPAGACDDYLYNPDVAEGFVLATLCDTPRYTAYNLGAGQGFTHDDIARALLAVLPDTRVEFTEPDSAAMGASIIDRARCVMDIRRAAEDFGFQPRYLPLERAFDDFLAVERRLRAAAAEPSVSQHARSL